VTQSEEGGEDGEQEDGVKEGELCGCEVDEKAWGEMPWIVEAAAIADVEETDPIVLGVPPEDGKSEEEVDGEGEVRAWAAELEAGGFPEEEEEEPREPLEECDVFAEETESHPEAGPGPEWRRVFLDGIPA
jgi:hypothetical protein